MATTRGMTVKRPRGARSVWKAFDELTPEFAALITQFTKRPRVTYGGRGFGARALRVDRRIFAMLDSKGRFVVKVPRVRADALLARGQAVHFEPVPGRPMKEWLVVTGRSPSWLALAREAYEYVASL
jgi:hypothetical protein